MKVKEESEKAGLKQHSKQQKNHGIRSYQFSSVQFSRSVMSNSLWPHGLQHARPPCPSPNPGVYSNSCPLSRWCHPTVSSSVIPFSSCLQIFPSIRVFSNESVHCIRWPKYWSFSFNISPSNEHPGLISFTMDWLDLLAVQGTLRSFLQYHSTEASILWSHHVMVNRWGNSGNSDRLYFEGLQNHCRWWLQPWN